MNYKEVISAIGAAIIILLFFYIIFAFPVMLLWNWLMPVIFGLTEITFFQALGLMLLCGLLFKSTGYTSGN
jgi:hypothetical protein